MNWNLVNTLALQGVLIRKNRKKFETLMDESCDEKLITKQGLDLLNKMLVYDHEKRVTAEQALKHPFFK